MTTCDECDCELEEDEIVYADGYMLCDDCVDGDWAEDDE